MKKYLLIIGIILIPVVVYAWGIGLLQGGSGEVSSCPPWYADANVTLSWKPTTTTDYRAFNLNEMFTNKGLEIIEAVQTE